MTNMTDKTDKTDKTLQLASTLLRNRVRHRDLMYASYRRSLAGMKIAD